jgi:SAM-dependent methyltransferase
MITVNGSVRSSVNSKLTKPVAESQAAERTLNKESYNAIARVWDGARCRQSELEQRLLDKFLKDIPPHTPILDLGCGTGRPIGEYLLGKEYDLTGVDQAGDLLAIARVRFPRAKWIESDIESFRSKEAYGGIVCWDALFHIQRHAHVRIFRTMAQLLNPGGRLLFTVGGSGPNEFNDASEGFTDTMYGRRFYYDSYAPDLTVRLLKREGFETLVSEFIEGPTPGKDKGRYVVLAYLR